MVQNRGITTTFPAPTVNNSKEKQEMAVTLKPTHLDLIITSLQLICDYKVQALRKKSWQVFETEYLPSALEQIKLNQFKLNNPKKNYFLWHLDNLCWSRTIIEGVKPSEGIPLIDTQLGQQVAEICRQAVRGQSHYDAYYNKTEFSNLFSAE